MRIAALSASLLFALSAYAQSQVGKPAKNITVVQPSGEKIQLASLKGKVVVCQGLFTWCPHCQDFSTMLSKLNSEYGPRGFRAVGLAFEDGVDATKVTGYMRQYAKFPVGVSTRETVLGLFG